MARIARVVVEGMPHHITQRGNRRQRAFFSEEDYASYVDLMAQWMSIICRHVPAIGSTWPPAFDHQR